MPIPSDQIDADARKVIRRLVQHNHEAYLVGGCVRDLLLDRKPKDFDIATSATPPEVKALFRNCRIIGRRFRLAHIFFGSKIIETATFRANPRDVEGEDGAAADADGDDLLIRRDNVFGNAEEDARRRDFTINGLFYDLERDEVIDYVSGLEDLAGRLVRTIGDAEVRFREDPVRILRAIKFAARLDFEIEASAYQAIRDHLGEIPKCAPPRVLEEIYRLMRGGAALRSMELLLDTRVLDILAPDVATLLRDRAGSQEARWLWQVLERIDRLGGDRALPSNAVLLCALLGPFLGEALLDEHASLPGGSGGRPRDIGALVEERIRPLLEQLRVSRRDGERARLILTTLRRLAPSKKRRNKPAALARRDYFGEALQVYELLGPVIRPGEDLPEELHRWRRMAAEDRRASGESHAAPPIDAGAEANGAEPERGVAGGAFGSTDADAEPRRRRRRRRGGRSRSGRSVEDAPLGGGDAGEDDELGAHEAAGGPVASAATASPVGSGHASEREGSAVVEEAAAIPREASSGAEEIAGSGPAAQLAPVDQASAAPPSTGSTTPVR